jgi:hypothetical protein
VSLSSNGSHFDRFVAAQFAGEPAERTRERGSGERQTTGRYHA